MKFIRTDTEAISCDGIRCILVENVCDLAVIYNDGAAYKLHIRHNYCDLQGDAGHYVQSHLLSRIMDFIYNNPDNKTNERGGFILPSRYELKLEDVVKDIVDQFMPIYEEYVNEQ